MKEVVIAGVFTIIGGTIGAVATYITAVKAYREQRFDSAAVKFLSAFNHELRGIYPVLIKRDWGQAIKERMPSVVSAYTEFYFFAKNRDGFNNALEAYFDFCDEHCVNSTDSSMKDEHFDKVSEIIEDIFSFCSEPQKKPFADRVQEKLKRLPDLVHRLKKFKT
jgi:hypothetical protein